MKLLISVRTVYMHIHSKSFNYTHCSMGWRVLWDLADRFGKLKLEPEANLSNEKGPQGWFRCIWGMGYCPGIWGLYHKPWNKAPYSTTRIQWKVRMCFSWLHSERSLIGKMGKVFQTISRFRFRPKIGTSSLYSTVIFLIPSLSSANQQKSTSKNLFVVSNVVHQPINPPSSMT